MFLVLMALVLCIFVASLCVLYYQGSRQARLILEDKSRENVTLLQRMFELTGRPLQSIANDYSLWDDMITFVRTADTAWGRTNIYVGLVTYQADAAWVYDPTLHLVYDTTVDGHKGVTSEPLFRNAIPKAILSDHFSHFFVVGPQGTTEFRTAPIQPSDDDQRATTPKGYLVVCKIWDEQNLKGLSEAVGGTVTMSPAIPGDSVRSIVYSQSESGTVEVRQQLAGMSGQPVAVMSCISESPLYAIFLQSARNQLIYFAIFCFSIMVVVFVAVRKWVSRPLQQVMTSLQTATPISSEQLGRAGTEFHHIGAMLSAYLHQQSELQVEVADRKEAEASLRNREALLRATLESTGDGILVVDRSGSKTHWNARFRQMWYIPEDIVRSGSDEKMINYVLNQLSDPAAFVQKISQLYDSNAESLDTLEFQDGRTFERFSSPLIRDGDVYGRVWSFRDVTQRKAAEEAQSTLQRQLDKAQRMESLGLLAGGVAHDLNNLLGPLVAYPEMILEDLPEGNPAREDIMRIGQAAEQASSVIQDLLAMARRGRYDMKPTDLNAVVSAYLDSIACRDLQSRRPDVKLQTSPASSPLFLLGSSPHLMKVVMNLVGNAIEASPDGGRVTIVTEERHLDRLVSGYSQIPASDYVVLRVIDTGTGIAPEDVAKIFEPYFSKKKMGRSGSGLGLAVVHGIVQDHGGYYDVLSTPGKGSEFVFYFPKLHNAVPVPEEASRKVGGEESVLVVDDDQDQRTVSTRLISSLGYRVSAVASGEEALEYLKRQGADVLVLDMIMDPGADGLDTYREILKIRPNQRAIIATGFSATDRVVETQKLGAGVCVNKPYRREQIGAAIRDELDRVREESAVLS